MQDNGAVIAGVAYLLHDTYVEFDTWTFLNNWAFLYPLMYLRYTSNRRSSIIDSQMTSNIIPSNVTSMLERRLSTRPSILQIVSGYRTRENDLSWIKLIQANMYLFNCRTASQDYLIQAIDNSTLEINALDYGSPVNITTIFKIQSSSFILTNSSISTIQQTATKDDYLISISVGSDLNMTTTVFDIVDTHIISWDLGTIDISNGCNMTSLTQSVNNAIYAKEWTINIDDLTMQNAIITNIDEVFYFIDESKITISNSNFSSFNSRLITLISSDLSISSTYIGTRSTVGANLPGVGNAVAGTNSNITISNSTFESLQSRGSGGVIWVTQALNYRQTVTNQLNITDSTFYNNSCNDFNGGAIYTENVDVTITGGSFTLNTARRGGAIYFSWNIDASPKWSYSINSNTASNNSATRYGGFLYTDLYEPSLSNITLSNNTATLYGNDYGAYPVNIQITLDENETLTIVSGNTLDTPIQYIAYDFFNQVAVNLGNRLAALQIDSSEIQLQEQNRASSI